MFGFIPRVCLCILVAILLLFLLFCTAAVVCLNCCFFVLLIVVVAASVRKDGDQTLPIMKYKGEHVLLLAYTTQVRQPSKQEFVGGFSFLLLLLLLVLSLLLLLCSPIVATRIQLCVELFLFLCQRQIAHTNMQQSARYPNLKVISLHISGLSLYPDVLKKT